MVGADGFKSGWVKLVGREVFEIECDEVVDLTVDGGVRDGLVGGIRQTEDGPVRWCDGFDCCAGEDGDEVVDFVGGLADEGSAGSSRAKSLQLIVMSSASWSRRKKSRRCAS